VQRNRSVVSGSDGQHDDGRRIGTISRCSSGATPSAGPSALRRAFSACRLAAGVKRPSIARPTAQLLTPSRASRQRSRAPHSPSRWSGRSYRLGAESHRDRPAAARQRGRDIRKARGESEIGEKTPAARHSILTSALRRPPLDARRYRSDSIGPTLLNHMAVWIEGKQHRLPRLAGSAVHNVARTAPGTVTVAVTLPPDAPLR